MSDFWNTRGQTAPGNPALSAQPTAQEVVLDEVAYAELQETPTDVFEEEEEDTAALMVDANLRLEQGRLYQMVLQNDIFADTNADPRAIKNVQREIRRYVRERMETMLGIRQEQPTKENIVSSPFNDLEVTVLKMLASKMSKGATEEASKPVVQPTPVAPKKDGLTAISGTLRPNEIAKKESRPLAKPVPQPVKKSAIKPPQPKEEESYLKKDIKDMTAEELAAHNKLAEERSKRKYATMPNNLVPHPNPQQLEALYTMAATQTTIANPWRVPPT